MSTRSIVLLVHFLGYFTLFLALALAAMNVVRSSRRALRGAGASPIPLVVTVLGVFALRVLSLTLQRPALLGLGPVVLVMLLDAGSWLLPPIVCGMLGLTGRDLAVPASAEPAPPAEPTPPVRPAPLPPRSPAPGGPSPFAKNPPDPPLPPR